MGFIADLLERFSKEIGDDAKLQMPLPQYREIISSKFMEEIRERARAAARLSPRLAIFVAPVLYDTFLTVDRIYHFRGASETANFDRVQIEKHLFVTKHRIEKLEQAQGEVEKFLEKAGIRPEIFEE
jgi:hypothetical protein